MVNKFAAGKTWRQGLLSGPTMVVEAARQTIKLFIALIDSGTPNYLMSITSPLAAVYALAVHIFQERNSLLIRSDFEVSRIFNYMFEANPFPAYESWHPNHEGILP
jgi:hypothetical protein